MTATRIYVVPFIAPLPGEARLVRASSQAQAINHVMRNTIHARVATQDDIVQAMQDGAKIETASQEPHVVTPSNDMVPQA